MSLDYLIGEQCERGSSSRSGGNCSGAGLGIADLVKSRVDIASGQSLLLIVKEGPSVLSQLRRRVKNNRPT